MPKHEELSRRERQIMDIVYARGEASVNDVWQSLPDPPSRTSVRTLMRILEEKGHLGHRTRQREFIYRPTRARTHAGRSALRRVLETFFGGSLETAVALHLSDPAVRLSAEEKQRLARLIEEAQTVEEQR
jgi:predicted transcriptional regulator